MTATSDRQARKAPHGTGPDATSPTPSERPPTRFGYQPALDGLRAVAVLTVIAYHFGASWMPGGFLGVDTFFVLSGFLITSLLLVERSTTNSINLVGFWARRARRLLPALVVVLIAVTIWASFEMASEQLGAFKVDALWTLFYGANWRFIASGQSYFDLFTEPSPLRHTWSLAIEEQFYLLWPLIVFGALWLARGRHVVIAVICGVGIIGSAVVSATRFNASDPSRAYYGTDSRASQLLIGALLAVVLARWTPSTKGARIALQIAAIVAVAVCVWMFATVGDRDRWLYEGGFLLFAVATAVWIAAIVQTTRNPLRTTMTWRVVRWIGLVSYGLYLWHWPVVVALSPERTGLDGWPLAVLRLAVTFTATALSYYLIELPIRHHEWPRRTVAWIAAPLALALTAGVILVGTRGATKPPEFLTAAPGEVLQRGNSVAPPTVNATPPTSGVAPVRSMLLIGDSVADTLGDALGNRAAESGVAFQARTRPGCGLTTGIPVDSNGVRIPWGPACAAGTVEFQALALNATAADTVVWLSSWEAGDFEVNGRVLKYRTPEWDAWFLSELEGTRNRLRARGARLVLLTVPPRAPAAGFPAQTPTELVAPTLLTEIFTDFAAQHPTDTVVIDLASLVCPGGVPCPPTVGGVVLRPRDGAHFEGDGPAWVAPRLYASIIDGIEGLTPASPTG